MPAARPGEAGRGAELFPRPVAEDAPLGGAVIPVNEKGARGPQSLRSPEVASRRTRSRDGLRGLASSWEPSARGKRASYLARLAGVGEGVDVLGAEAHCAAVDTIEIGAPGRVVGVAAREGWRRAPGCRRPQEPGQRAEQGEPRAAGHGGRRARRAAEPPWGPGSAEPVPPKPPRGPGARFGAERAMPGKDRATIGAAARGLGGRSRPGVRGREMTRWGLQLCAPVSKSVS